MQTKQYFGTDGIRGKVGKSLISVDFMLKLGAAFGRVINSNEPRILIGRDTRNSGLMLESALQAGLSAAGATVQLLGVMPTPGVAYLTHSLRAHAGIVISASHNAYTDNGIKFFDAHGRKLSDEVELAIENALSKPLKTCGPNQIGKIEMIIDASGRYIEFCKSILPDQLNLRGIKVVLDCANGAGFAVAPKIFHELGAEVIAISNQPNGKNINEHCGATDVRRLQSCVVNQNADVGIALDGDGDRLIMVDHLGERVDGDELLCIIAKDRLKLAGHCEGVVGTVMSNLGLEQALHRFGIQFVRTPVGDRYVIAELLARQWTIGGESSGHLLDLDFTTTGDGIISALQILRIMQLNAQSLNELKQCMTKCPQVMINVPVYGESGIQNYPKIQAAVEAVEAELKDEGRVLLRPSGTEPVVRVMVEGFDEQRIRHYCQQLADIVKQEMQTLS